MVLNTINTRIMIITTNHNNIYFVSNFYIHSKANKILNDRQVPAEHSTRQHCLATLAILYTIYGAA